MITEFKSRLTIFLFSIAHCLAPAPLKHLMVLYKYVYCYYYWISLSYTESHTRFAHSQLTAISSAIEHLLQIRDAILTCTRKPTHKRVHLTVLFPEVPWWAGTRKVIPIWILLTKETVSGSGISWDICKSAPHSKQITTPAPQHSIFTGRMPFLLPNQWHQSTEGSSQLNILHRTNN